MKANIQPRTFKQEQIKQAQAINVEDYCANRLQVFGVTIDDATTVDRDDGVWLRRLNDEQFELQVSITDVSALIAKDSPIDQEALARVVTLYHTNPPTPMLPCHISTNLGSLEEDKQTLALTIFFIIDKYGNINSFEIKETIFSNKKAFSYEEVEQILQNPQNIPEHKMLCQMQMIAQLISKNRGGKSGTLTEEGYIDEDGNLIQDNVNAHQLIAELMILTNSTIARYLAQQNIQAIYRTQDVGTTDFNLVMKTMGHCLVPAKYEPTSKPHVGLALMNYTHFTSPLRRFVDLVNHRILKNIIHQQSSPYSESELTPICERINNFTSKLKLDRANYLRIKRQRELHEKYSNLENLNVEQLTQDELSDLIQYCAIKKTLHQIKSYLKSRIKDLQPKDFYYLWFIGKINDFWQEDNINAVSVLLVKSHLDNSAIAYQSEYCEFRKSYFAWCYIDSLTTKDAVADRKKSQAKQKAALASIKGYIEGKLNAAPNAIPPAVINNGDIDLTQLNDKDFSKLLDYSLQNNLDDNMLMAIEKRINQLLPKDLYKIWFKAKINKFFDYPNLDSVSVLLIHSQLTNSRVEYQFDYLPQTQQYCAHCYVDGWTHPTAQLDGKKNKAKQKAALAYIQAYINNQLSDRHTDFSSLKQSLPEKNQHQEDKMTEEKMIPLSTDWVSKLYELSQSNTHDKLDYEFNEVDGIFICIVSFIHENVLLKSTGYGKSKKEAKQMASKVCLIQHNL